MPRPVYSVCTVALLLSAVMTLATADADHAIPHVPGSMGAQVVSSIDESNTANNKGGDPGPVVAARGGDLQQQQEQPRVEILLSEEQQQALLRQPGQQHAGQPLPVLVSAPWVPEPEAQICAVDDRVCMARIAGGAEELSISNVSRSPLPIFAAPKPVKRLKWGSQDCNHDEIIPPVMKREDALFPNGTRPRINLTRSNATDDDQSRKAAAAAISPMRFFVSDDALFDTQFYCSSASATVQDMLGGTIGCSADTVLTDAKRNILLNLLIPAALTRLSALLSVESVTSNIIVPTSVCSQFPRPASFSTTGVGGTDFVVLLAAAPINGGAVAWASYCALDNGGRPVVGRVNFNPAFIVWSDTDTTVQEQGIRAVMHEMCHALGFSVTLFLANPASGTIRDKPAQFITTPNVVAEYQIYTNCPSIRGPEVEDQGTAGTPGSHWERRNLRDDLMAGIITTGRVSRTTLAVFQDSGLYSVNFANAESMTWGLGTGCDFLTQKCNTPASGVGTYWCNSAASVCNFDRSAFGPCMIGTYSSALPTYFQYFSNPNVGGTASLMDFCPIASDSTVCVNENVPASTNDLIFGSTISVESRCFDTNRLLSVGYTASTFPSQTCLKARCVGGTRIEVAVHNTGFIQCPLDGSAGVISAPGYTGTINCPPAPVICDTTVNIVFGARGSTTTTNNFNSATALHAPMTLLGVCVAVGAVALGFVAL